MVRLKEEQQLFQQHDDGVTFIGRSLFRASVDLPVNVPIGRYAADIYLFRDGMVVSKNHSTLEVSKAGFERAIYLLAFQPAADLRAGRGAAGDARGACGMGGVQTGVA